MYRSDRSVHYLFHSLMARSPSPRVDLILLGNDGLWSMTSEAETSQSALIAGWGAMLQQQTDKSVQLPAEAIKLRR
ncbi:MAG: hypothetical protein P8130_03245 [Deltaproteobacteria bacterium]